jgi:hypothetical protein
MRGQYWLSANVLKADEDKTYPLLMAWEVGLAPPSTSTAAPGITEDILASQEPGLTTQQARATVSGKTAPGATIDIAASQPGTKGNTTVIVQIVAGSDGSFHAVVPTPSGQSILTVSVTAGGHATGWAQQTVTGN